MALLDEVSSAHSRSYDVNGQDDPSRGTPAPMALQIDGDAVELNLMGSQHVGACLAALCAMADADTRGVTHLRLNTRSNLLRNHAKGRWDKKSKLLNSLHIAIVALSSRFEEVEWP